MRAVYKCTVFQSFVGPVILLNVFLLLSACGGDSGTGGTTPPINYQEYQDLSAALNATWVGVSPTDPGTLPISGAASYSGYVQLSVETATGELGMAGSIDILASFLNSSLSGSASGFVDQNANQLSGTLAITGGVLDRSANTSIETTYSANLGGTLTGGGDQFVISGDVLGDFLGAEHLASSGVISGSAISGFGNGYMFGSFLVAQ